MNKEPIKHISLMKDDERLQYAAELHSKLSLDVVEAEDIYQLMNHSTFETRTSLEGAVNAMAYIRLRDFQRYTRVQAFKSVFPTRWKETDSDTSIRARAHSFESTKTYKQILMETQMNFYGVFAIDRVHVLNDTLRRAYDTDTSEKYRFEYFKLFLESTRQPDAMQSKIDVNIKHEGVSIKDVENQLDAIAEKLVGKTQEHVVDAILVDSNE